MQLVQITDCFSDIRNRQFSQPEQFGGLGHAVGDQEFLGRFACIFMEDLTEITPVQAAGSGDIFYGDAVLEVLFNIGEGFLDIEIAQTISSDDAGRRDGAYKAVNEKEEMSDQMKGRLIPVIDNIEHF